MANFKLSPYYHPTTICFIDDNESYLESLNMALPRLWSAQTFADAEQGLAYLQIPDTLPPLVDRCFSIEEMNGDGRLIHLDLGIIEQEIKFKQRFRRCSVAVIDYSMHSMNGLELCAQLSDPYMKKVLLTGVADEILAVEAFNAGIIDCYIPKRKTPSIEAVIEQVINLQYDFFAQYTHRLTSMLALDPPGFLTDRNITHYVGKLMRERLLVEYYLVNDPPGFLFLDSAGRLLRLMILDSHQVNAQFEFARQHNAPEAILRSLQQGEAVGYFVDSPENYFGDEDFPWNEMLFPAFHLPNSQTTASHQDAWLLGIDDNPPQDVDFDTANSTYDAYLQRLSNS